MERVVPTAQYDELVATDPQSPKAKRRLGIEFSNRRICSKCKRMFGRGEWIRTTGLLVPNQALYQAEPRPDEPTV
jgi:hypothetical protein